MINPYFAQHADDESHLTLLHIGIGAGLVVVILILLALISLKRLRDIRRGFSRTINIGGITVSGTSFKDEHLSSNFVLGAIENGVVMVKSDRSVHLFNQAASTITGWPADEAVGMEIHTVMPLLDRAGRAFSDDQHPFTVALKNNQAVRDNNLWLTDRKNKRISISLIVSPILDPEGKPTGSVVGVFSDMTREREEEARRTEFISTASHEMRSPLTAIDGYLALALNTKISKIDDNARKYLQKAAASTQHLSALFSDLLTSSKAEDGRLASNPVVIELGEIAEQVSDAERLKAKNKNLALRYIISSAGEVKGGKVVRPLYYCYVDPTRIQEVLQNLIDNAIKYTPEGSITVKLTGNNSVIQVQVQDTGSGIAPEDIPHLFQKFYRVDNSMTRTIGGTGLGLFICRKIVELYSGRLWVESELGKGSTFFINLPRLTSEQALQLQKRQADTISPLDNQ